MNKITDSDINGRGIRALPDVPALADGEMQRKFDEIALDAVIPRFNGLVDDLTAASAAGQIGAAGGKVQSALDALTNADAAKANAADVIKKGNTDPFTPALSYDPATKKYVDDTVVAIGSGDMCKSVYDLYSSGAVENTKRLGGVLPAGYAAAAHTHEPADLASAVPLAKGGTGATNVVGARANLEVLKTVVVSGTPGNEANTLYFVY